MEKRSTTTNLLAYTSCILESMETHKQVDAIYTDFSAAFDKINHKIMIAKLKRLGISGCLLDWFHSYLVDRFMTVKISDTTSTLIKQLTFNKVHCKICIRATFKCNN